MPDDVEQLAVGTCEIAVELRDDGTGMVFRDRLAFESLEEASEVYDRMVAELTKGLCHAG